jgi:MFS transporter, ACS family, hexuronate transporter
MIAGPKSAMPVTEATGDRRRWIILGLLFASTVINYLDRQALSILAPVIQDDLKISDAGYAHIVQLFLIAYTAAFLFAGRLTDLLGTRRALALFVAWWSLANFMTAFVRNAAQLGVARFALGLGEAGNYTSAPKIVSERFPEDERSFAVGVYTAGAMVGATLAPPLIGGIALYYGWRAAFAVTGAAGFVWLIAWFLLNPKEPQKPTDEQRALQKGVWRDALREPSVWMFALARAVADPVWYFYLFWFPKYLSDVRGMTLAAIAGLAWTVYLAADFGAIGGGLASGHRVRRGAKPTTARLQTMGLAVLIIPFGALSATHPSIPVLLCLGAAIAFAHQWFQVNVTTLIIDVYPQRMVGTLFGLVAAGSGLGGILSTQLVGQLVEGGRFDTAFLFMAVLHPIAWVIAWLAVRVATARQGKWGPAKERSEQANA